MLLAFLLAASTLDESAVRALFGGKPHTVLLPPGTVTLSSELVIPAGFHVRGQGTVLEASRKFRGRALLVAGAGATVSRLTLDGNRAALDRAMEIAPYDRHFLGFYDRNGITAEKADGLTLRDITIRNVSNYAVLIHASSDVTIERVRVTDSGSRKANGRNNASGGILLEEGTSNFRVSQCSFTRIRGNGVWTHSLYTSPRNGPGAIEDNHFDTVGRDAIQAGHATQLSVVRNTGRRIGWPFPEVDTEGAGIPVAIDTAGNVDQTNYSDNVFEEINGKCIDLDGFHHGKVTGNRCLNRGVAADYPNGHYGIVFNNTNPDMQSENVAITGNVIDGTKFGGIFVIGRRNVVRGNQLRRINLAGCNEAGAWCLYDPKQPDLLRAGIYIGSRAERPAPASENEVSGNIISGHSMAEFCVVIAPDVERSQQRIGTNECRNQ